MIVDSTFPRKRLFTIPKQFQWARPQAQMCLTKVLENGDARLAAHVDADVMVLTWRQDVTGRSRWSTNIDLIAVTHRDHSPCMLDMPLNEDALRAQPLIRIAGRDNP